MGLLFGGGLESLKDAGTGGGKAAGDTAGMGRIKASLFMATTAGNFGFDVLDVTIGRMRIAPTIMAAPDSVTKAQRRRRKFQIDKDKVGAAPDP
jgi:regulator of protease activity HflC (stomatin/prohibitin superfamily)